MLEFYDQSSVSPKMQYIELKCCYEELSFVRCSIYETPDTVSFENESLELIMPSGLEFHVQSSVSPKMWYIGLHSCYDELLFAQCSIYEKADMVCFEYLENESLELIMSSQMEFHIQSSVSPKRRYTGCYEELYFVQFSIYEPPDMVCFENELPKLVLSSHRECMTYKCSPKWDENCSVQFSIYEPPDMVCFENEFLELVLSSHSECMTCKCSPKWDENCSVAFFVNLKLKFFLSLYDKCMACKCRPRWGKNCDLKIIKKLYFQQPFYFSICSRFIIMNECNILEPMPPAIVADKPSDAQPSAPDHDDGEFFDLDVSACSDDEKPASQLISLRLKDL